MKPVRPSAQQGKIIKRAAYLTKRSPKFIAQQLWADGIKNNRQLIPVEALQAVSTE